jgi:hypothetical protein
MAKSKPSVLLAKSVKLLASAPSSFEKNPITPWRSRAREDESLPPHMASQTLLKVEQAQPLYPQLAPSLPLMWPGLPLPLTFLVPATNLSAAALESSVTAGGPVFFLIHDTMSDADRPP